MHLHIHKHIETQHTLTITPPRNTYHTYCTYHACHTYHTCHTYLAPPTHTPYHHITSLSFSSLLPLSFSSPFSPFSFSPSLPLLLLLFLSFSSSSSPCFPLRLQVKHIQHFTHAPSMSLPWFIAVILVPSPTWKFAKKKGHRDKRRYHFSTETETTIATTLVGILKFWNT